MFNSIRNQSLHCLLCFCLLACTSRSSSAAIFVDFVPAFFTVGSGVQEVIFRAKSDAADSLKALTLDFRLPNGGSFSFVTQAQFESDNLDSNSNSVTSGPFYTRLFNESNYIGFGNINKQASILSVDTLQGPAFGNLALEFSPVNGVLFPADFQPLGKLRIDVTGLAIGNYGIAITASSAFSTQSVPITTTNGSFEIIAVPEPSTLALLLASTLPFAWRRIQRTASELVTHSTDSQIV